MGARYPSGGPSGGSGRRTVPEARIRQRRTALRGRSGSVAAVSDEQLERYRSSIDNIDAALIHLLAERFKITQEVGRYKAAAGLPAADLDREAKQVAHLRALAEESGLDPVFSEKFLRFIVAEVIHHHQRIAET